ncbi:MAG: hypothetical protein WCC17_08225 [Candidatus Nitrosopolaris sp.]
MARKYISTCRELNHTPKPPGEHSKKLLEGWNEGIIEANGAASNDDNTYGNQCLE